MTREQKIWRLNKHCSRHKCNQEECRIYQECSDSAGELLETLDDTEIDKLYNKLFGTQITENFTGVVKEDHERVKTATDTLEEVKQEICDDYCIYTKMIPNFNQECKDICDRCPLNKL